MFSSQKDQNSYIEENSNYSDFTKSFILSLTVKNNGDVRYKGYYELYIRRL